VLAFGQAAVAVFLVFLLVFFFGTFRTGQQNLLGSGSDAFPDFQQLGSFVVALIAVCALGAWCAFRANRGLLLTGPVVLLLGLVILWIAASPGLQISFGLFGLLASLIAGVAALLQVALLAPQSRLVLMRPELRWWQQAERKPVSLLVRLDAGDAKHNMISYDASETGLFLCMSDDDKMEPAKWAGHVERGDPVELEITDPQGGSAKLVAEICRIQVRSEGGYPRGFGVRFVDPSGPQYDAYQRMLRAVKLIRSRERGSNGK
jgi:hypothetical protein